MNRGYTDANSGDAGASSGDTGACLDECVTISDSSDEGWQVLEIDGNGAANKIFWYKNPLDLEYPNQFES